MVHAEPRRTATRSSTGRCWRTTTARRLGRTSCSRATYEGQHNASELQIRRQAYWAVTRGRVRARCSDPGRCGCSIDGLGGCARFAGRGPDATRRPRSTEHAVVGPRTRSQPRGRVEGRGEFRGSTVHRCPHARPRPRGRLPTDTASHHPPTLGRHRRDRGSDVAGPIRSPERSNVRRVICRGGTGSPRCRRPEHDWALILTTETETA